MEELTNNQNQNSQAQDGNAAENDTPKTYTQEEVDALLQREADRRVSSALAKQERKFQAQQREAAKLSQMNDDQKRIYELEKREAEVAEKEHQLLLAENRNAAGAILVEKGLGLAFIDFVISDDAETINANISKLEKAFKAAVKAEVERRIGSKAPAASSVDTKTLTREQFNKMSMAERQHIADTDRETYNAMVGR